MKSRLFVSFTADAREPCSSHDADRAEATEILDASRATETQISVVTLKPFPTVTYTSLYSILRSCGSAVQQIVFSGW
jgi:hypothetical protein